MSRLSNRTCLAILWLKGHEATERGYGFTESYGYYGKPNYKLLITNKYYAKDTNRKYTFCLNKTFNH